MKVQIPQVQKIGGYYMGQNTNSDFQNDLTTPFTSRLSWFVLRHIIPCWLIFMIFYSIQFTDFFFFFNWLHSDITAYILMISFHTLCHDLQTHIHYFSCHVNRYSATALTHSLSISFCSDGLRDDTHGGIAMKEFNKTRY